MEKDEKFYDDLLKELENIAVHVDAAKQLVETRRQVLRDGEHDVYKDGPPMAFPSNVVEDLTLETPAAPQVKDPIAEVGVTQPATPAVEDKIETLTPNLGSSLFGTEDPVDEKLPEPAPIQGGSLYGTPEPTAVAPVTLGNAVGSNKHIQNVIDDMGLAPTSVDQGLAPSSVLPVEPLFGSVDVPNYVSPEDASKARVQHLAEDMVIAPTSMDQGLAPSSVPPVIGPNSNPTDDFVSPLFGTPMPVEAPIEEVPNKKL